MQEVPKYIAELYRHFIANGGQFTTDTRRIKPNDIYFALKGDNFNGNLFAEQALELGASLVVVDEETAADAAKTLKVGHVLETLQALSQHHRRQFDIPVLAIAGSNGKTTTKELVTLCLAKKYKVHATKGNLNNHIGVPISMLGISNETEIAVIEIGTNSFGEIAFLSELLEPNYGIITNIGKEHLEGFGSIEGVAREESELFNFLHNHHGFAFVNADDVYLQRMSHRLTKSRSFGLENDAKDRFIISQTMPHLEIRDGSTAFISKLQGKHNGQNMAAAICIGRQFEVSDTDIADALASYEATNNRSEWRTIGSNHFLLDAYNANPSSMLAALDTFRDLKSAKKVILLGDMFELGSTTAQEHKIVAEAAWSIPDAEIHLVGNAFSVPSAANGYPTLNKVDELINLLKTKNYVNTWFLIKGSRGMQMERVLEAFSD